MNITIHNAEDLEPPFMGEVLSRLLQHEHVDKADIYVEPRSPVGWVEYLMVIKYTHSGKLTVGCIQRKAGGKTEFHT